MRAMLCYFNLDLN